MIKSEDKKGFDQLKSWLILQFSTKSNGSKVNRPRQRLETFY